jgi:outer membrane protein OmpA-like peptidoglycan-associated protein
MSRRSPSRAAWAALLCASVLSLGVAVRPAAAAPGLDSQRFVVTGGPHGFVTVQDGRLLPLHRFGFDAVLDLAYRPLATAGEGTLVPSESIIDGLIALHLRAAFAPTRWLEFDLSMPLQLAVAGDAVVIAEGGSPVAPSLGDLWIDARFQPLDEDRQPLSLSIAPFVTLPTGRPSVYLSSGVVTFGGKLAVGRRWKRFHFGANVGARVKPRGAFVGTNIAAANELLYGLGLGVSPVLDRLDVNLELNGGGYFGTALGEVENETGRGLTHGPLELLLDARVALGKGFSFVGGIGRGVTPGVGSPAFRGFLGVSYAPGGDRDRDGILDAADACVDVPEDVDAFEDVDGCPDLDNDKDGIVDSDDKCPNDPEDADSFEDWDGCVDPDNDADGIRDTQDKCPNEPEDMDSWEDADGCPDPDNDLDGLVDGSDSCPNQPETKNSCKDEDGCPENDKDKDGIADDCDATPDQPETYNGYKDQDGSPDEVPKALKKFTGVIQGINFELNSDKLTSQSTPILDKALAVLKEFADTRLEVQGHTSAEGEADANMDLSQRRAGSVVKYFVDKGVDPARLVAKGYGETTPIAPDDAAGRKKNRRVEFKLLIDDRSGPSPEVQPANTPAPAASPAEAQPAAPAPAPAEPAPKQ